MKRDPEAIFTAVRFDPARRELFTEGKTDVSFMRWLAKDDLHPDVTIMSIDFVNVVVAEGGNRGRLLELARLSAEYEQLKFFADADWDRLLGRGSLSNLWLTDHRDLEGYVLSESCLAKVLLLGIGRSDIDADTVLRGVLEVASRLGALRLASERGGYELPFQMTRLAAFVSVNANLTVDVREQDYLAALVAGSGWPHDKLPEIQGAWTASVAATTAEPSLELVHGKDAFCLLGEILATLGVHRDDAPRLLWTSFDSERASSFEMLDRVHTFLVSGN